MPYVRLVGEKTQHSSLINEPSNHRLLKDYLELLRDPLPDIIAKPLDESLLLWGYAIRGAKDTPFDGTPSYPQLFFVVGCLLLEIY